MQIWPFKRKPKPRTKVKDIKPPPAAVVERFKQAELAKQSPLKKLLGKLKRQPETSSAANARNMRFGESFRRERTKHQQTERIQKLTNPVLSRIKIGFRLTTVIAVVVVVAVIGAVLFLNNRQVYLVKDITITGNDQIPTQEIMDEVADLRGKSMFSFSESGIEARLVSKFTYIKLAQVRKQLPGKITIDIEERYPAVSYINLAGVFLIDDERVVVSQLGLKQNDPMTADEMIVISGYGDPNANYSKEHYLSRISEEDERKAVKWDEVKLEDKKAALNDYRNNLLIRVDTTLNNNITALLGSEFTQLPKIMAYDSQVYSIGSDFSEYKYSDSKAIADYLNSQNLPYTRILWQSDFTLQADLVNGIKLLFTSTRSISDQLTALDTVRSQGNIAGATQIDLRSEIVAVR